MLILVVDDDEPFRRALRRLLEGRGYEVEDAAEGAKALRMAKARRPDLVITDIIMPDYDGIELIGGLKREQPGMPILAMSGGHIRGLDLLSLAAAVGADAVLPKPFEVDQLVETVARLTGAAGPGAAKG